MPKLFGSISRKLTIVYGAMFAAAILLSILGASFAIERHATATVSREMAASTEVFQRVLDARSDQLRDAASITAADFGFREAVALGEAPTIVSALDNLKERLGLSLAMLITVDGDIVATNGAVSPETQSMIYRAVDAGSDGGILTIGEQSYGTVASEIRSPLLAGWVVFGYRTDRETLAGMAGMSSLPVDAQILDRGAIDPAVRGTIIGSGQPLEMSANGERILLAGTRLESLVEGEEPVLLTRYSLSEALAGYSPMLWTLAVIGFFTLMLVVIGSYFISNRISRPIQALAAAARRVSSGDDAEVKIETHDEIGDLAADFNKMVDAIGERERRISHLAFYDTLTDLPNRVLFREQLTHALQRKDIDGVLGVLVIDLDNFKAVNDTLGHPVGDKFLGAVGKAYREALAGETIARLSGDEFAVLVEGDTAHIARRALDIINATSENFLVDGHNIATGASVGIAIAGPDGDTADELLKNADLALYRVKEDGKGTYRFFEERMDEQARERREMELDLREALKGKELELHFQPLYCLKENRVSSFEALLRWNHPERGLISPVDFIPLAEETGLIVSIGEWVIHEACRIAASWSDDRRVAVNISPVQFRNPGLKTIIVQALARTGLEANRLEIEITESLFIHNTQETMDMLHAIHRLGVRIALDDFGTGYSSLGYLRSFPFDKIKIDRSFVMDIMKHDKAVAIIRSITTLAEALGMETTAEGVEESAQLDILRREGCSHIQGYLFGRPMAEGDIAAHLGKMGDTANDLPNRGGVLHTIPREIEGVVVEKDETIGKTRAA